MTNWPDPEAACRKTLDRQLELASTGRHRVKVPAPRGLMRRGGGRHHHFTPETFFQVSGRADFDFPQQRFTVSADEICAVPACMPHRETVRDWRGPFCHIVFMFTTTTVAWHLKEGVTAQGRPATATDDRVFATPDAALAIERLMELCAAAGDPSPSGAYLAQGALLAYLALLRRLVEEGGQRDARESHRVALCRHEVARRLDDPELGVPLLARRLACSPNYLSHRFRRETGSTLIAHIERERMAQAKALLATTALSVKEIAAKVGHPDASYFARVFRRHAGLTPRQYRARAHRAVPVVPAGPLLRW